jgi:hypothetical protein
MHGHERAALRTEKELRHQAKNEVDYPPEILDAWRGYVCPNKSIFLLFYEYSWYLYFFT